MGGGEALEWGLWQYKGSWYGGCGAEEKLLSGIHKNIMDGEEKTYGGCEGSDAVSVKLSSQMVMNLLQRENMH